MPNNLTDNLSNNSPILSNSLTDTEIKKALEDISHNENLKQYSSIPKVAENALNLINHLQAGKEHYKKMRDRSMGNVKFLSKQCDELQAEVERLQDSLRAEHSVIPDLIRQVREKAYKEFAEKLKEKAYSHICRYMGNVYDITAVEVGDIDNLLNELVGDINGKDL